MSVDNLFSIRDIQDPQAYLLKGMSWPPVEDETTGDLKRAEAEESISVCIRHLLETAIGGYPVIREFGTRLEEVLFAVETRSVMEAVASSIKEGIVRFERRVTFVNTRSKVEPNNKGTRTVFIEVMYRINATGQTQSERIEREIG